MASIVPWFVALALGFVLAVTTLALFAALAEDVYEHETIRFDARAGTFLHRFSTPPLDAVMTALTFIGSSPVLLAVLVVVGAGLLRYHRRREALFLMVAWAGGILLSTALKLFFHRPRPTLPWSLPEETYSFPSGHAMNSLILYLGLACVAWMLWGRPRGVIVLIGAALLVLGIGVSRVYLGYHYLSDVIGAYCAGLCWLISVVLVFAGRRIMAQRQRSHEGETLSPTH